MNAIDKDFELASLWICFCMEFLYLKYRFENIFSSWFILSRMWRCIRMICVVLYHYDTHPLHQSSYHLCTVYLFLGENNFWMNNSNTIAIYNSYKQISKSAIHRICMYGLWNAAQIGWALQRYWNPAQKSLCRNFSNQNILKWK